MSKESERNGTAAVAVGFLVIIFAATVWPSIHRTYPLDGHTYRQHRLTGKIEVLTPAGWITKVSETPRKTESIPPDILEELDRGLVFRSAQHSIWTKLYNRTAWTIYGIIVDVRLKDGTSRRHVLTCEDGAAPSETNVFHGYVDIDESEIATTHLASATGTPPASR